MKRINFIFTGVYLKVWYVACVITIALMVANYMRLSRVVDFELAVFDSSGKVVETQQVRLTSSYEKAELYKRLPVTKSFTPIK
jgi:hypothetical protein